MSAYYNEFDPFAAAWLRELIAAGHIAPGDVDTRSIKEVQPDDLRGYDQCHFFAGIGGWSYALRLAGWADSRPVWTGSCPCQPFSVAGKGAGVDDPRHLWPDFLRLIRAGRPPVVLGEQVAGKAGYGWFDGVCADLEGEDYAGRGVDIPACAVDAPHIRQRLYWIAVGDAERSGLDGSGVHARAREGVPLPPGTDGPRETDRCGGLAIAGRVGLGGGSGEPTRHHADGDQAGRIEGADRAAGGDEAGVALGDACPPGLPAPEFEAVPREGRREEGRAAEQHDGPRPHPRNGTVWSGADWLACHDGKARRTQPGLPLLAHGVPNRVGLWRGFGNAIVPQEAAEVIGAWMDVEDALAAEFLA